MDGSTAHLDGDDGVQGANRGLEWCQVGVLVWEDPEVTGFDPQADASRDVLFGRLKPSVSLGLGTVSMQRTRRGGRTLLKMWWSRAS